jgi:hypothetical protein
LASSQRRCHVPVFAGYLTSEDGNKLSAVSRQLSAKAAESWELMAESQSVQASLSRIKISAMVRRGLAATHVQPCPRNKISCSVMLSGEWILRSEIHSESKHPYPQEHYR